MKALVSLDINKYTVEEVALDPPKAGEIKVKIAACGVCHSDLSVINGKLPLPRPIVLGHEGAGIVEELGEGVTGIEIGDHVVLAFNPSIERISSACLRWADWSDWSVPRMVSCSNSNTRRSVTLIRLNCLCLRAISMTCSICLR